MTTIALTKTISTSCFLYLPPVSGLLRQHLTCVIISNPGTLISREVHSVSTAPLPTPNVRQVVPFFLIADMDTSLRFYLDGLGFTLKNKWVPDGKIRWCWLELGAAALMLQEYRKDGPSSLAGAKVGQGVSLAFQCQDALALYREFLSRNLSPSEPFVGNSMWVTHLLDPDGYRLEFESPTDVPEETKLSEWPLSR